MGLEPAVCPGPQVLCFLQSHFDQGKAVSMIKVYASDISAFHQGGDNTSLGRHSLISQFLKGACRFHLAKRVGELCALSINDECLR